MSFLSSLDIAGSGLTATRLRMDIISENITNQSTTRTNPEDEVATPYRRKLVVYEPIEDKSFKSVFNNKLGNTQVKGVRVAKIVEDERDFTPVYNPEHPDANEDGYVLMPNVDPIKETLDMMAATRAYDANITAFNAVKSMALRALEIGK
ncbi:MAG: flagellar basal body rod protein FlgC [Oscillospiraceae bacterium]